MTKTFSTNSNNDLYIGTDGNLVITTGLLAVRDACAYALKTQLGEMVLNTDQGILNFQAIWRGSPNVSQFEAAIRKTILSVADVVRVISLITSVQNNTISYTVTILTSYGQTAIDGFTSL